MAVGMLGTSTHLKPLGLTNKLNRVAVCTVFQISLTGGGRGGGRGGGKRGSSRARRKGIGLAKGRRPKQHILIYLSRRQDKPNVGGTRWAPQQGQGV